MSLAFVLSVAALILGAVNLVVLVRLRRRRSRPVRIEIEKAEPFRDRVRAEAGAA